MTTQPDQHVAVTIDGTDLDGTDHHTDLVVDSQTGDSVAMGDALSNDAQEFMSAIQDAARECGIDPES